MVNGAFHISACFSATNGRPAYMRRSINLRFSLYSYSLVANSVGQLIDKKGIPRGLANIDAAKENGMYFIHNQPVEFGLIEIKY